MPAKLLDFVKDAAAQELLEMTGYTDAYEAIIEREALAILRQSVSETEIESIRFIGASGCSAGGMPISKGSSKITMQELKIWFPLEIVATAGPKHRHRLLSVFEFDSRALDTNPQRVMTLVIKEQEALNA